LGKAAKDVKIGVAYKLGDLKRMGGVDEITRGEILKTKGRAIGI
jgi:hypothetical protein